MAVQPAGRAPRQRLGLEYPPRDRPRQRIGGDAAELGEFVDGIGEGPATGRGGEYRVAVEGGVRGVDGAREPILRDDGEFLGLRLAQHRVGRHQGDGRILAWPSFRVQGERRGRHRRRKSQATELAVHLERCCPEMRAAADIDAAAGIDRDERADRVPIAGHRRSRAEPALEIDGGGAEAGAGGAERKRLAGARSGGVAEIAIGRKAPPVLVAAVEEVEQHSAAHDRHANVPDREATPALAQQSLNACPGVQAEGGAAGQHHGIDALDGAVRFEQIGFPRAGRAAAHVDRGHRRLLEHNGGHAGGETRLVGVSDPDARNVGDEIALRHTASPAPRKRNRCQLVGPDHRSITSERDWNWRLAQGRKCTAFRRMAADVTILAALFAGLVSFLSPCVLPLVPPYLVYLAGTSLERLAEAEPPRVRRDTVIAAVLFVLGFSTVFVALGASASMVGALMRFYSNELAIIAGIVIIVMGLHFLGLTPISLLHRQARFHLAKPVGLWGAYVMGLAFALGWTPCIGPILAAILAVAASKATVAKGAGLLAVYSLGLGVPFIIAALAVEPFAAFLARFRAHLAHVERVMGVLLVLTGIAFLPFLGLFTQLNSWLIETFPVLQNIG